jgi:hypothetical protein
MKKKFEPQSHRDHREKSHREKSWGGTQDS